MFVSHWRDPTVPTGGLAVRGSEAGEVEVGARVAAGGRGCDLIHELYI